jgi:uncharacterized protein
MKRKVFVFDTNALISAFLVKKSLSDQAFRRASEEGILAMSNSLMSEFLEVLWRGKFDRYFIEKNERAAVILEIEKFSSFFIPNEKITDCTDQDDNMILELAIAANASCIITGDKSI